MIAWVVVYSGIGPTTLSLSDGAGGGRAFPAGRFASESLLLALTVLSNFFNAITAAVFILATIANDLVLLRRAAKSERRREERNALLVHLLSPIIALLLTFFWIVPMITESKSFFTHPFPPT